ncbi:PaaI family thioesterase [bacterium]|nr:PaaI family thioesterase [candidate division CSSED10-310 bacterium]
MIIPVKNIFADKEGFNCFACGPLHPFGLRLTFSYDTDTDEIFTRFIPTELYAGFPAILHGGIQATILDEIAFWGAWARFKQSGFTYDLKVRFRKKCPVGEMLEGRGRIGDLNHRIVTVPTRLMHSGSREIYTEGTIRYYLPDRESRSDETVS